MIEDSVLDDFEEKGATRLIPENPIYRVSLTILWGMWSALLLYRGALLLFSFLDEIKFGFVFRYVYFNMNHVFLIGTFALGMAFVIFKALEDRLSYLFSFLVFIFLIIITRMENVEIIVFLPILGLLFAQNIRTGLICYTLSLFLFIFVSGNYSERLVYLFSHYNFLITYILVLASAYSYRTVLFPMKEVRLTLKYRLFVLVGFSPVLIKLLY